MSSFPNFLRTPPHIIQLRFQVMLVAQYQAKKERLAEGKKKGWDVSAEEAFVTAREWQYNEAVQAIKGAPLDTLAQALSSVKLGRPAMKRLNAAGVSQRVTQARRSVVAEG